MNEIFKDRIHAILRRTGFRVLNPKSYRFEHDVANYHELDGLREPVVFDVGANIGQTSLAFHASFPKARIYAFEPFAAVFESLFKNVRSVPGITPFHLALGSTVADVTTCRVTDHEAQTFRVAPAAQDSSDTETVKVTTIDAFCLENGISRIDILKTDTEGSDLEVLKGAEKMLANGKIGAVLSEASIRTDDLQHSKYRELHAFLQRFEFELFSIYSIRHAADGRMDYFNALFKPRSTCNGVSI